MKILSLAIALTVLSNAASAEESYDAWETLQSPFPSTAGNDMMITGYNPVVVRDKCVTPFSAVEPSGTAYHNIVEFEAVPAQGGILCTNGKWRAVDGSSSGTTPLRVHQGWRGPTVPVSLKSPVLKRVSS